MQLTFSLFKILINVENKNILPHMDHKPLLLEVGFLTLSAKKESLSHHFHMHSLSPHTFWSLQCSSVFLLTVAFLCLSSDDSTSPFLYNVSCFSLLMELKIVKDSIDDAKNNHKDRFKQIC